MENWGRRYAIGRKVFQLSYSEFWDYTSEACWNELIKHHNEGRT